MVSTMDRRMFLAGLPFLLGACQSRYGPQPDPAYMVDPLPDYASIYRPMRDGGHSVPPLEYEDFDPSLWRQMVHYPAGYIPGTIVVDPYRKFLYFIQPGGKAMRYGIGVGKAGFAWSGDAVIREKRAWPRWLPPKEMIARDPSLKKYADGQVGGPSNPLGARALYLWQDGKDTLYRIHGTGQPKSIGQNVSSGCIRLWQQDIIDLYDRVETGARVIVLASAGPIAQSYRP